jgi:serine/threonine protein kinase
MAVIKGDRVHSAESAELTEAAPDPSKAAQDYCRKVGFKFMGLVGSGAFKDTFHVKREDGGSLALKLYKAAPTDRSEREIAAMKRFDHPNVGRLLEVCEIEGVGGPQIVLIEEYLSGGSLASVMKRGLLPDRQLNDLAEKLTSVLCETHARGLVHRDIKPDNIMFRTPDGEPVLVDFGLVRDLSQSSLTQSWQMRGPGTPYFAAPEQLLNEKAMIDWRADQFGLGVTLSVAALGCHPFAEPGEVPHAVIAAVAERRRLAPVFISECKKRDLGVLERMVQPWPVSRFRLPSELLGAWTVRKGGT